jgi:peptide deformylase
MAGSKRPIITVPNPLLRQKSKPVDLKNPKVLAFIRQMADTLLLKSDPPGVGLSAVQVGKLWRILLLNLPPGYDNDAAPRDSAKYELTTYINPVITAQSKDLTLGPNPKKPLLEGCLSIPNLWGPILRPTWIDVSYETIDIENVVLRTSYVVPQAHKVRLSGFAARVFLHEFDHFEAVLFTDHSLSQNQPLYFDTGDSFETIENPAAILIW